MEKDKRKMTIQQALEWAFFTECAQLDLPLPDDVEEGRGFGMEYVLLQQGRLGTKVDTSRRMNLTHDDAEVIASIVANIPQNLGGRRMALQVAECGRCGFTPDWMPGAEAKIEPHEWVRGGNRGRMAKREVLRQYTIQKKQPHPKNPARSITRRVKVIEEWCRITYLLHPQTIETAHQDYSSWRAALVYLREVFQEYVKLSSIEITEGLPPDRPWLRFEANSAGDSRPQSTG